jgi:hypothetical protein
LKNARGKSRAELMIRNNFAFFKPAYYDELQTQYLFLNQPDNAMQQWSALKDNLEIRQTNCIRGQ